MSDSEFEELAAAIGSVGSGSEDEDEIEEKPTRKRKIFNPENEETLNKVLFGDKKSFVDKLDGEKSFFEDLGENEKYNETSTSVWHDSDDENVDKLVELKSKKKFERITGINPSWASFDKNKKQKTDDSDDDDEISRTVGHLSSDKTIDIAIPKGSLNFKRLANMNKLTNREGRITAVEFHPRSTVGIVAGIQGMVSLFAIDGKENKKIHNIKYEKYSIHSCKLVDEEMILGGLTPFYHSYNLMTGYKQRSRLPSGVKNLKSFQLSPCGKLMAVVGDFGEIHLLHGPTKELFTTLKQEHHCTSLSFSQDSRRLFAHSDDNEVTVFNMSTHRIEHRFVDDGCVNGTSLAISGNSSFIATGSRQGYVNLYKYDDVLASKFPKPLKAFDNLKTEITEVKFNPSNEILGFCSVDSINSLKFAHIQSSSIFDNFPMQYDVIGKVTTLAFSPAGGFLGIGNVGGQVPLYRLKHFNNY